MSQTFSVPRRILTGAGCFDRIGSEVAALGASCLIVTGRGAMQAQGILDKARHLLKQAGVASEVFSGVEHDPSLETVEAIRAVLRDSDCDIVLGLGGGSALDAAKAAAGLARTSEPVVSFYDGATIPGGGFPFVAAPSTFGTGTEATPVSVLSDPARKLKKSIRHDDMLPRLAVVDPVLSMGAPARLTAACGLDALTQAIESYLSIHATDLTRSLSFGAMMLLASGLPRAFDDGHDLEAREHCANGSLMAGMALHNARLGLVHGLAHPLGAHTGIAHGEACGILLPHVLRYNREAAGEHYALLSRIFGGDLADYCETLLRRFGLPTDLKHLGVRESDLPTLVAETMPSGSTKANPRKATPEDVESLLRSVLW